MTPDPLLLDETHAWLDRARRDLRSAKVLIGAEEYAEALFHCQQAAEKAVKGFLTFHPKNGDLEIVRRGK
jgi:HEPN domain-containing protein